ncbi:hypothetical protein AB0M95_08450 [Sphaerisporangium sp. NPDC051017]|uniref:hypothetical protein n=1 Tax=Sphaerisporangium sp. NPDC051017 TaxID=3154636 RepID=UPI00341C6343
MNGIGVQHIHYRVSASSGQEFGAGDVTTLVVAGLFTVVCLVLAWLERRGRPDDGPEGDGSARRSSDEPYGQ